MNDQGDLTPPTSPDPPQGAAPSVSPMRATTNGSTWWRHYRRFIIPGAAVLALAAATAGALALVLKPAITVEKMAPASANLLVVANVDPSTSQKVNLLRALHTFPDLSTDKAITDKLDQALKDSGLSFTKDIQPWMGGQVGVSAQISADQPKDVPVALYLVARDDAGARAMLAKLRTGKLGSGLTWQDTSYSGITISVGTPKTGSPEAYAYVDHVAVLASSASMIQQIIDTDQGRAARLVDSAQFHATMSGLPSDRIAYLYLDGQSLMTSVKKQLKSMPATTGSIKNLSDLDAFQGIGATLSANGNGLVADLQMKIDSAKLSPATRAAMATAGHPAAVLRWIPRGSDAFLAFGNLNQTLKTLVDQAGTDPAVSGTTDAIGLTGPGGVLNHLTGDAGVELEVGSRVIPAGAILLGTDNAASTTAFFKKLILTVTAISSSQIGLGPTASAPATTFKTTSYRGVVITSYAGLLSGTAATAFQPSFAVLDGMGILASNVAEARAVIDAHLAGTTIAGDATYQTAVSGSLKQPSGILYVNVGSLTGALRRFSAESGLSSVDTRALANLAPVRAFILTSTSQVDALIERLFVVIQ